MFFFIDLFLNRFTLRTPSKRFEENRPKIYIFDCLIDNNRRDHLQVEISDKILTIIRFIFIQQRGIV